MTTLQVRNVHEALPMAVLMILRNQTVRALMGRGLDADTALAAAQNPEVLKAVEHGSMEASRNGPVAVFPTPISIYYERPQERVLFWPERDANPYLHFMEALWMLAGRNDAAFPALYAKQLLNYSDDGATLHGAYGYRWREFFHFDQLHWVIKRLQADPNDRRVVVSMWQPAGDNGVADSGGKDVPCNTHIYFAVRGGALCMQVCCRSNDLYWGCLGANAVHFSMLQEYIAGALGLPIGWYFQTAFNLHWYDEFHQKVFNERSAPVKEQGLRHNMTLPSSERWNPYMELPHGLPPHPMMRMDRHRWDSQLSIFMGGAASQSDGLIEPFFRDVAVPIRDSHAAYRSKDFDRADNLIAGCAAPDWRRACREWLGRRADERAARVDQQDRRHAAG